MERHTTLVNSTVLAHTPCHTHSSPYKLPRVIPTIRASLSHIFKLTHVQRACVNLSLKQSEPPIVSHLCLIE